MLRVGLYKTFETRSPNAVVHIQLILEGIKNGRWKEQVEEYRETKDDKIKDSLPCYTAGGVWGSSKAIANMREASNLVSLDIDDFEGDHKQLLDYLEPIKESVYHISRSSGNRGYCVLVFIKDFEDYPQYQRIYHAIYTDLEITGLGEVSKFDYLQNLNRLRFVSYDADCITYDEKSLVPYQKELIPPNQVEIREEARVVKKFAVGGELSDEDKFETVLEKFKEHVGDFGQSGTRHDWILGIARWSCRAGISEAWLDTHLRANYTNSSRPQVWNREVSRCIKSSYNTYRAEQGTFEITKKFDYNDILSAENREEVKTQVYLLIADKLNYADYLTKSKKSDKFVKQEITFLKKIIDYL